MDVMQRRGFRAGVALALLLACPAAAEVMVPPGFTAQVYVSGDGFSHDRTRGIRGIPSVSTLAFDGAGTLYLARTGRRYTGGEGDGLWPIYRIPPGGAHLTTENEPRYFYGPPLLNAQVAAVRPTGEVLLTTFDPERRVGVVYRLVEGRAVLVAGGTPLRGERPLLRQPEGAALDPRGNLYVADRDQGVILRLDAAGRVLDTLHLGVLSPRLLALDKAGNLWVGSDGTATVPWLPVGKAWTGEIWRVTPDGRPALVLGGLVAAGIAAGPGEHLFVADRHAARLFALGPEGRRVELARFTDGDAPRALAFAPDTQDTRASGIAGDLFVVTIRLGMWPVNEVLRISGPFGEFVRRGAGP